MPADPNTPAPNPGPTPTGFQRTQGGGFKWQPPTAEHLAKLLSQYEIERLLGHGGMGAVYKGMQKSLHRAVAIKILPPGLEEEDASYVERFKNEARVMARLDHPAIVPVYDFGETSEGQLYIVMAFVDGTDVQKMIQQQGRLPPEHALAVTAHVCDALGYAHNHGVVHRDIKPANILINMEGQVKVADFGLAKAEEAGASGLTKTGMAMGTPDYVAPEALMMGVNVDGRADLYAVGVMLYAMLTGNVPRGAFKPASVMIREIDPRFDTIVQKAMQMDREERYQSAAEIRRDLDVILTMPMVQAGGKSSVAIPKQSLPAKPAAKGPQKPMGKSANVPIRGGAVAGGSDPGSPGPVDQATAAKSKAPLFIGLGLAAAIAVGAFVMMGGKKQAQQGGPLSPLSGTSASSASDSAQGTVRTTPSTPIKVRDEPKPPSRSGDTPVVEPRPPSTAATTTKSPATASVASASPAGSAPPAPTPATGVSPLPSPAPPVSSSPSLPVSQSSPQFPPGQWVKLTLNNAIHTDAVISPDGTIKFGNDSVRIPVLQTNFGIRGSLKRPSKVPYTYINIRNNNMSFRRLLLNTLNDAKLIATNDNKEFNETIALPLPPDASVTQPVSLEFVVIGDRSFGRVNQKLLPVLSSVFATGSGGIQLNSGIAGGELSNIEVINLDGIPEAEALRILGVDEKGNDLRAAAVVQQQTAAAQAKQTDAIAAIPELKALHDQLTKLTAERVTAPFDKDVAALNTGYLGGIDRKIAEEKAAGHLGGVLALEAEKKFLADKQPVPATDEAATPEVLKGLRQIYRDAFAKLEATRAANLKALTDPLTARLRTLEADLTKADRIAHAQSVREYREGLGKEGSAGTLARNQNTGGEAATMNEAEKLRSREANLRAPLTLPKPVKVKADPEKSRQAAEYALSRGASVLVLPDGMSFLGDGKQDFINPGQELPKGKWQLHSVKFPRDYLLTDQDLETVTQASELKQFLISTPCPNGTFNTLRPFQRTPSLIRLDIFGGPPNPTDEDVTTLEMLSESLTRLDWVGSSPIVNVSPRLAQAIGSMKQLQSMNLGALALDDDDVKHFSALSELVGLSINSPDISDAGIMHLTELRKLESLLFPIISGTNPGRVTGASIKAMSKVWKGTLKIINFGHERSPHNDGILAALAEDYSNLTNVSIRGPASASSLAGLQKLRNLQMLAVHHCVTSSEHAAAIAAMKDVKEIKPLSIGALTAADVAGWKGLKKLEVVEIGGKFMIDDAAALEFGSIKTLKSLTLPESKVSLATVETLRGMLPDCKITLVK